MHKAYRRDELFKFGTPSIILRYQSMLRKIPTCIVINCTSIGPRKEYYFLISNLISLRLSTMSSLLALVVVVRLARQCAPKEE